MDNKKPSNRKFLIVGVSLVVLVVAGLVLLGYLAVTWKQPHQQVVLVTRVCGDDVVTRYNKVSEVTQSGDTASLDEAGLKSLVAEVKTKKNYQQDPTCQTILLAAAIHYQDYNSAKAAYNAVKTLHDQHFYADSNLNASQSLSAYETLIQELAPSNTGGSSQEPQGGA